MKIEKERLALTVAGSTKQDAKTESGAGLFLQKPY